MYGFCLFDHVMLLWKICENGAKIRSKITFKFTSQLTCILDPNGLHFGRVGGSFWHQNGTKLVKKSIQKSIKKMLTFWMALRSNFVWFWLPSWCPRGVTDLYIFNHFWVLGPSWPQDPPRPLQEASWDRFWTILASNLVDFGLQLGGFWMNFKRIIRLLVGWLGWLFGWLLDWLAVFLVSWLSGWTTIQPNSQPTSQPTKQPTSQPASQPTSQLANQPTS